MQKNSGKSVDLGLMLIHINEPLNNTKPCMKIKFSVESIQAYKDSFLSLQILQDSKTCFQAFNFSAGNHEFEFESSTQTHIDFVISNKNPKKHTVVDDEKIVKDTLIRIKQISVDDQDLTYNINLFSNYFTKQHGIIRTNGHMTFNGTYRFKFRYPGSNHILFCTYYKSKN